MPDSRDELARVLLGLVDKGLQLGRWSSVADCADQLGEDRGNFSKLLNGKGTQKYTQARIVGLLSKLQVPEFYIPSLMEQFKDCIKDYGLYLRILEEERKSETLDAISENYTRQDKLRHNVLLPIANGTGDKHRIDRFLGLKQRSEFVVDQEFASQALQILGTERFVLFLGGSGTGKTMQALWVAANFEKSKGRAFLLSDWQGGNEDSIFDTVMMRATNPLTLVLDDVHRDQRKASRIVSRLLDADIHQNVSIIATALGSIGPAIFIEDLDSELLSFSKDNARLLEVDNHSFVARQIILNRVSSNLSSFPEGIVRHALSLSGNNLSILHRILANIDSVDEAKQLDRERLYNTCIKEFFGRNSIYARCTLEAAALCQFGVQVPLEFVDLEGISSELISLEDLVSIHTNPGRISFVHQSSAELVFLSLCHAHKVDQHELVLSTIENLVKNWPDNTRVDEIVNAALHAGLSIDPSNKFNKSITESEIIGNWAIQNPKRHYELIVRMLLLNKNTSAKLANVLLSQTIEFFNGDAHLFSTFQAQIPKAIYVLARNNPRFLELFELEVAPRSWATALPNDLSMHSFLRLLTVVSPYYANAIIASVPRPKIGKILTNCNQNTFSNTRSLAKLLEELNRQKVASNQSALTVLLDKVGVLDFATMIVNLELSLAHLLAALRALPEKEAIELMETLSSEQISSMRDRTLAQSKVGYFFSSQLGFIARKRSNLFTVFFNRIGAAFFWTIAVQHSDLWGLRNLLTFTKNRLRLELWKSASAPCTAADWKQIVQRSSSLGILGFIKDAIHLVPDQQRRILSEEILIQINQVVSESSWFENAKAMSICVSLGEDNIARSAKVAIELQANLTAVKPPKLWSFREAICFIHIVGHCDEKQSRKIANDLNSYLSPQTLRRYSSAEFSSFRLLVQFALNHDAPKDAKTQILENGVEYLHQVHLFGCNSLDLHLHLWNLSDLWMDLGGSLLEFADLFEKQVITNLCACVTYRLRGGPGESYIINSVALLGCIAFLFPQFRRLFGSAPIIPRNVCAHVISETSEQKFVVSFLALLGIRFALKEKTENIFTDVRIDDLLLKASEYASPESMIQSAVAWLMSVKSVRTQSIRQNQRNARSSESLSGWNKLLLNEMEFDPLHEFGDWDDEV